MRVASIQLIAVLSACVFISQSQAWAARFVDTSGDWTEKYVNRLSDKGFISASTDGKFNPDKPVTRAQLADWMVKVLGLENQPVPSTASFADVKLDDWYFKPVEIIRQNNLISGYADGFRPNQFIQRAEVLTIISRALNMPEPNAQQIAEQLRKYQDGDKVPSWAKSGVAMASLGGIVVDDKNPAMINPTSVCTRGETIAFLSALDEYEARAAIERASKQGAESFASGSGAPPSAAGSGTAFSAPVGAAPAPQFGLAPGPGAAQQANVLQGSVAIVTAGTTFRANLANTLDSGASKEGEPVQATLVGPVLVNGVEVVPSGSRVLGAVSGVRSAKHFRAGQNGRIDIRFTELVMPDGRRFPLSAAVDGSQIRLSGGSTAGRVGKTMVATGIGAGSGAILGTAVGAIVGGSNGQMGKSVAMGAIMGTAIGAGGGAVAGVVRKGSEVKFPAGMSLPIKLDAALQVTSPVPSPYYGTAYGAQPQQPPAGNYGNPQFPPLPAYQPSSGSTVPATGGSDAGLRGPLTPQQ